jgi:hypothetical protein
MPVESTLLTSAVLNVEHYRSYRDIPYLEQMSSLLSLVDETRNIELIENNMKLKITTSEERTEFAWLYTESGVDFTPKSLSFIYENHALKQITDGWFLFDSGSTEVNISRE